MKCSLGISSFLEEISSLSHCFPLFLCIAHLRLSSLSLLFFGTLHSDGYIFPFHFTSFLSCWFWQNVVHWRKEWPATWACLTWEPHEQLLFFSHSVMSDSFQPHGLQHARLPCPSPSPRACSNSCPLTVMPSKHCVLCCPLLLLPSIFPSIRVFPSESALRIRWQSTTASASASVFQWIFRVDFL